MRDPKNLGIKSLQLDLRCRYTLAVSYTADNDSFLSSTIA